MSSRPVKKILLSISIIIVSIFVSGCQKSKPENSFEKEQNAANQLSVVNTVTVMKKNISLPIRSSGILCYKTEKKISFRIGGIIHEILVDDGAIVKKGQLLARLDSDDLKEKVNTARIALDKSHRDYKRFLNLKESSATTSESVQNAHTLWKQAEINLKIAESNLTYAEITAFESGTILKKLTEANEVVEPGQPVFEFASGMENWEVITYLSDCEVVKVKVDDNARVYFDAYPDLAFKGKVAKIATTAEKQSGTVAVKIELEKTDKRLICGFIGKVSIQPSDSQSFLVIPVSALAEGTRDKGYVYKVGDEGFIKTAITISELIDEELLVSSGLKPGDKLAAEGSVPKTYQGN